VAPPTPARRRPLVLGNWKMNRGGPDAADLARAVVKELGGRAPEGVEIALLPPFTALSTVASVLEGTGVGLGAQSCHGEASGAFTGEISAEMLASCKCAYVLCGHSERRMNAGERDSIVQELVAAVVRAGLRPVLCVGESLEDRESGREGQVIHMQVVAGIGSIPTEAVARLVIAYEPVWAIGTGRNATPEQVVEAHEIVREALLDPYGADKAAAKEVRVVYGGSVKPGNAAALLSAPGVDGALVGGASLDAAGFAAIVRAAAPETSGAALGGK